MHAAEEIPMPAEGEVHGSAAERRGFDPRALAPVVLLVAALAFILLRQRR